MPSTNSAEIRPQFDAILMRHVSRLIDTRKDIAALPFNLATIACLLLLVERENEIKTFPESPPDRYNRESFFNDIEEVGIDLDEDVLVAIQNLDQYGFVVVGKNDSYTARESATLLIMLLDAIFPQMPGMNLVAYVSQAIEEVVSGRKDLPLALSQFDQTLEKQGIPLSTLPAERLPAARQEDTRQAATPKPDPAALQERRAAYLKKLTELRSKGTTGKAAPAVVTAHARYQHVEIKELFPKAAPPRPKEEPPPPEPEIDTHQTPSMPLTGESGPAPVPEPPATAPPLESGATPSEEVPPIAPSAPPDTADHFSQNSTVAVPPPVEEASFLSEGAGNDADVEDLIAQRIKAFEQELALPCPVCNVGKILSETTDKGKTYFLCSNQDCKLISWGKPYHLACPLCKNPFLVEFVDPEGNKGLKCPRATCLYRKIGTPDALPVEADTSEKKKVAVVKRRKKGVRRVVRRKS